MTDLFDGPPQASFMITRAQRAELARLGYSEEAIRNMTPADAHKALGLIGSDDGMPPDPICETGELLTQQEAADLTGYCREHMSELKRKDKGPPTVGYRKSLRYPRGPLLAWAAQRHQRQGEGLRVRWNGGETQRLEAAIFEITAKQRPMTIRQLYYQLVVRNLIDKTEAAYDRLQQRLTRMRDRHIDCEDGGIDPDVFFDSSRRLHIRQSFETVGDALRHAAAVYRQDFWHCRSERVVFWLEKEGLAEQVKEVAWPYDIPVYVAKGFSSISYVRDFVDQWNKHRQPTTVYYFRDLDPSGVAAPKALRERLDRMMPDDSDQVTIEVVAVTLEQIAELNLERTAQPTKTYNDNSNSHYVEFAKAFPPLPDGSPHPSYELDAFSRPQLQALAMECIRNHVTENEHSDELAEERKAREKIAGFVAEPKDDQK